MVERPFRQRSKPRLPLIMRSEKREIARERLHGVGGTNCRRYGGRCYMTRFATRRLLVNSAGKKSRGGVNGVMERVNDATSGLIIVAPFPMPRGVGGVESSARKVMHHGFSPDRSLLGDRYHIARMAPLTASLSGRVIGPPVSPQISPSSSSSGIWSASAISFFVLRSFQS
jgi:hypothetical protein